MVAAILPVKRGLSSPAVTSIPEQWDRQWFRYFIDNFLSNADIRNVSSTSGISVSGNVSGNSTTGNSNTNVTISLAPLAPNSVLGNITAVTAPPVAINTTQLTALINLFSSTLSGAVPLSGGGTINFLRADGAWANPSTLASANPTAKVGPVVVNGAAITYMRSDAAPPIDLTANYAWTGTHSFNPPIAVASGGTGTTTPGLVNGTGIAITGTWPNQTITSTVVASTGANPTASVGLAAVNGTATTFMRSDGAPPLSQAITPTWTGAHIHTPASGVAVTINAAAANLGLVVAGVSASVTASFNSGNNGTTAGADLRINRAGGTTNQGGQGANLFLGDTTGNTGYYLQNSGGQFELWNSAGGGPTLSQRLVITTAGNIVCTAPTSGDALTVQGSLLVSSQTYTYKGTTASTASGTPVTLQALPGIGLATYLVSVDLFNVNDSANYNAVSLVCNNGTSYKITSLQAAGLMTITLSGANVQATQGSGSPNSITYSIIRIA